MPGWLAVLARLTAGDAGPLPPPGLLPRVRLHRILTRFTTGSQPIGTVYAPAGSGKTTVLLDWIAASAAGRGIVYIDLARCDQQRWWRANQRPAPWWPADAATAGELRSALRAVCDPADASPAIVVLDGTETVTGATFSRQLHGLAAGPGPLRIILVGRCAPAGEGPGTPAPHPILSDAHLMFTDRETAELCARRGLPVSAAVRRRLYAITGGWPVGLAIAADELAARPHDPEPVIEHLLHTGEGLEEYLHSEVLSGFPARWRDAVRDTSVVESVNSALFEALTGHDDAGEVLAGLAREAMFAVPMHPGSDWFRYRRLWRSSLYTTLTRDDPTRARHLHRTAAAWYCTHDQPAEALRHALAGRDRDLAIAMARTHQAGIRAAQGRAIVTAALPQPWSALRHDADLAAAFDLHAGRSGSRVATAPPRRPAGTTDPGTDPDRHLDQLHQALGRGEPAAARASLTHYLTAAGADPGGGVALRHHAVIDHLDGRLHQAAGHAATARAHIRQHGITGSHDEGWALVVLAATAVQQGHLDVATRHLDTLAIELWQSDPALLAAERLHHALMLHQRHQHTAALAGVEQLIADDADTLLIPRYAARTSRIDLLLAIGRTAEAERRWAGDADPVAALNPAVAAITTAKLLVARPAPDRVEDLLRPVLQAPDVPLHLQVEALLVLADHAARTGAHTTAGHLTRQAITLATPERLQHPFLITRRRHLAAAAASPTAQSPAPPADAATRQQATPATLTHAELAVLRLLPGFMTVTEIAGALHLSVNTVKSHLAAIYRKLDVHRRRDAIRRGHERGLL
ncbi:LuxR C-terminal-related transcriptional regulator [Dactylosporangium sp. NPDC000521]|uniref:LuxR C-terminal-related transcriptional regulator n=1 Tax=Dactylosporangium sp. NPDC000521 TaxID=3363975 RepID=UPI00369F4B1F